MRIITLIFALIGSISFSQNMFIGTSSGELWKTNPATCNATLIGSCPTFVDIAFLPNGKLYGQTFSAIYEVDTLTAASTLIMTVSSGNSLVGAPNGMLYAVSGTNLLEIDVVNGTSTSLGNVTCSSGGDLAFFNGELYLACSGNNLLKINMTNPSASTVVGNMSISGAAYGLVNAVNGCQEFPYVMSSSGLLYPLDYNTAGVGAPCSMGNSGSIWGAASPNEFAGTGGATDLLGNDTTLCNQASLTLTLPNAPNTTFLWSDNSTGNSLTVNTTGIYWVDVTDNAAGCTLTDTIEITFLTANAGNDATISYCDYYGLNFIDFITGNPDAGGTWYNNDGSVVGMPINQSKLYNSPYRYIVNDNGCADTLYVSTTNIFADLSGFEYSPTLIFTEQTEVDFTSLSVADSLRWLINNSTISTNSKFTHKFITNGTQNVCLILFTDNCVDTICEEVFVRDELSIYIPNAFTPNNDGFNDKIAPSIAGNMEEYKFYIFNRWGEKIFETSDIGDTWDGTHENEKVSIGVYSWKLSYKIPNTADIIVKHGYFMLLK